MSQPGVSQSMFAIDVAQLCGVPNSIITRAQVIIGIAISEFQDTYISGPIMCSWSSVHAYVETIYISII